MLDDAINVHGTYLKVTKRIDDKTLEASYMHPQAYGFEWGFVGDEVQFINSNVMEIVGGKNKVAQISPVDKETVHGAKKYKLVFENPVVSVPVIELLFVI